MENRNEMKREYYTTYEVMDLLACSRSTVERLAKSGNLIRYRINGSEKGKTFYKKTDVQKLFKPIN